MTRHDPTRADRILDAIWALTAIYGHPPSVRAIGEMVGLTSSSSVHGYIARLLRDGLVVRCQCGCGRVRMAP